MFTLGDPSHLLGACLDQRARTADCGVSHRGWVQFRADDGPVRYYIAGEYKQIGDPGHAMTPGAVGTTLVQQHAVRVVPGGVAGTTVCGDSYDSDRLVAEDWESPIWFSGGLRCPTCINATGTLA